MLVLLFLYDKMKLTERHVLPAKGQLFLGKSFGALAGAEPPLFLRYIDTAVLSWMLKGTRPLIFSLLERLPIKSLREFLASGDGVYEVRFRTIIMILCSFSRLAFFSVAQILYVLFRDDTSLCL